MWSPNQYLLRLGAEPDIAIAEEAFRLAWRFDFAEPGFCLLDLGTGVGSHLLREWMVRLKDLLSRIAVRHV